MARNITIPIVQHRTIGALTISKHGKNDWRGEVLVQIAEHIRTQPVEAPDHYEVNFDGLVLEVNLLEDIQRDQPAQPAGDVAWDDPAGMDYDDHMTVAGD